MRPRLVYVVTSSMSYVFFRNQLRFMRKSGFDITIISSPGEMLSSVAKQEGVKAIAIPMRREPSPVQDIISLYKLIRTLKTLHPDIIHVSTPKAGLLGSIAALILGIPIRLYTIRGVRAETASGILLKILLASERLIGRASHYTYCISTSVKRVAEKFGFAKSSKLKVIGSGSEGVDTTRFRKTPKLMAQAAELRNRVSLPADVPVIGFVGRLVRDKGIVELLSAFKALRAKYPKLHLLIIGDYEDFDAIPPEARLTIEQAENIIFTGFLDDVTPSYPLMNMLVLPTYREGFPTVLLEAAAMELPVVATQATGCVDAVIDGVTGTLVPVGDAEALYTAIERYLDNPKLSKQHAKAGYERVIADFKPIDIWQAQLDEYTRLLKARGMPLPEGK